ncbi:hypothetical protein KJ966_21550 [bacterium]|nr:hypothetical protein [bacterium]
MKLIRILFIGLLVMTVVSCSPKLPLPSGSDEGLLIVPTFGDRSTIGKFVYRYSFKFNKTDNVIVKIVDGRSFISKPLKAGSYQIDSFDVIGVEIGKISANNKGARNIKLKEPFTFDINPGKVTFFPFGIAGIIEAHKTGRFLQKFDFFVLDEEILKEYVALLEKSENRDKWRLTD